MTDILEYLGDSIRPLKEGLNLYKSKHVLNVGMKNIKENNIEIIAEVVQSSDPKGIPHQVNIKLVVDKVNLWVAKCSCKAGLGRKCKHIFASLIYVHK